MRRVYMDASATTYCASEVINEMNTCLQSCYGNSNSLHSFGRDAAALVDKSRDRIAKTINGKRNEIYFTSGGTEANNLAILGIAKANRHKGNHIIVSAIEHESILAPARLLEQSGFKVTYLGCDSSGVVSVAQLLRYITSDTIMVSVMAVNNEIGTINHIKALASIAHEKNAIFHTDIVQALGQISIDVDDMGIDALSMSAHKIYGPKGIGALYVKSGVDFNAQVYGGNQEREKRAGTLNTAAVVGFGKAVEILNRDMAAINTKIKSMRDYFVRNVTEQIEGVLINGHSSQKINKIVNMSFENVDNEALATLLDLDGIAVSYTSACKAGSFSQSHVLAAMKFDVQRIKSSIRFSFIKNISKQDLDYVIECLVKNVNKLRALSPQKISKEKN